MDERLFAGVVGGLIGVTGAFAINTVQRWRDDERSRKELRTLLDLIIHEIVERQRILNNRYADWNSDTSEEYGDIVKNMNFRGGGRTFNYSEELRPHTVVFESFRNQFVLMDSKIGLEILRHYTLIEEKLLAHTRMLGPINPRRDEAQKLLQEIRQELVDLIAVLRTAKTRKWSRSFHEWLPLWLVGAS